MSTKKSIKDIQPSEKNIQLLFEVTKKVKDEQEGLLCKISDDTGTSDAYFTNTIKKYIQQNKVYLAKNAIASIVNDHIRIQMDKQIGTLSKQPIIIPFKDNTFDLSTKAWKKKEPAKKVIIEQVVKQETVPKKQQQQPEIQSQKQNFISTRKAKLEYKQPEEIEKPRYQRKQRNMQRSNNQYEKNYKEESRQFTAKQCKLIELRDQQAGNMYSVIAVASKGGIVKKLQKQFYQVDLSDSTGTIIGSFYPRNRLENQEKYELTNMKLRFYRKNEICLQQTKDTEIKRYNGRIKVNKQLIRYN